jgi:hypothetical protein
MDMRVISSPGPTGIKSSGDATRPRQQQLKELMSALKSGDLEAAKKAYAAINANATKGAPVGSTGRRDGPGATLPPTLAKIGEALANNDLAGAQKIAHDTHHEGSKTAHVLRVPPQEERAAENTSKRKPGGGNALPTGTGTLFTLVA